MDQLLAIRVFTRVVEAGNFTKAADSLQMPKATVTKLVQSLEAHLRTTLLQRTTRRVTVTAEGAAYYERVVRLLSELDDLEQSLTHAQAKPRGRLRVDVHAALARLLIVPALPRFLERYPDIQIDLGISDRRVDLIESNVDCVIRGGELKDSSLIARRLSGLSWCTCAAPAYIARYGTPRTPADLETRHRVVNYFSSQNGRLLPFRYRRKGSDQPMIEIEGQRVVGVNDSNAHLAAGLAGLGVIQSLRFSARPHIERGELVELLTDWERDPLPMHILYPPNRHLSNKVRVFIDWIAELFEATP
ncbi:MAG TPA: LysR substrate-binding domain-containing protein [Burkholderiales bacterium]|nr:LysR substrate-binding domain-containing protein [Burkholderiales bacterium]